MTAISTVTDCMRPDLPPMDRKTFMREFPPFSIALDGFVKEGPWWVRAAPSGLRRGKENGPYVNMNHHEGVPRAETRATCMQALNAIRFKLFKKLLNKSGKPFATLCMNDPDQDVCTARTLLRHPHLVRSAMNPMINRLVDAEDKLDTFAGAYPFPPDLPFLEELAWVFEPYTNFRMRGGLQTRDPALFIGVLTDVEARILKHITGGGLTIPLQIDYDVERIGTGFHMVTEKGAQARTAMLFDDIDAYVSIRERTDGRWTYTIGVMSPYDDWPIKRVEARMNELDDDHPEDTWGGGSNIIGSGRIHGSKLNPDDLFEVIEDVVSAFRTAA